MLYNSFIYKQLMPLLEFVRPREAGSRGCSTLSARIALLIVRILGMVQAGYAFLPAL
jgi:hypothetical protein